MSENHDDGRRRFLGYAALVALAPLAANQAVAQTKALPSDEALFGADIMEAVG